MSRKKLVKLLTERRVTSRRKSKKLILKGKVTVNGKKIKQPSYFVEDDDKIKINGEKLPPPPPKIYILLNKPKKYLTTTSDPFGRDTIFDLLSEKIKDKGVYPVGRLDFKSEGLIFLTNDGEVANKILTTGIPKHYKVKVSDVPDNNKIEYIEQGIKLDNKIITKKCKISLIKKTDTNSWFYVVLTEGKKNQIRRMFKKIGHPVLKLKRIKIGPFYLQEIPRGKYIILSEKRVKKALNIKNSS